MKTTPIVKDVMTTGRVGTLTKTSSFTIVYVIYSEDSSS